VARRPLRRSRLLGTGVGPALHDRALACAAQLGSERCHLWVLEENGRARRFYERRGWRENGHTRVVPFPPNPLDVGYTLSLESGRRLAPR
jgi:RimJ/RimL family protein N-acetyltransferase